MIAELLELGEKFEKLDERLTQATHEPLPQKGMTAESLAPIIQDPMQKGESPRRNPPLPGRIEIVAAYDWHFDGRAPERCQLVLRSADGRNLLLSDSGLCEGPIEIPEDELMLKPDYGKALPAEIKPRSGHGGRWDFAIPLANGYSIVVRGEAVGERFIRHYGLKRVSKREAHLQ
jgi:hypothetical protein